MARLLKRPMFWVVVIVLALVATFVVVGLNRTAEITTTNEETGLMVSAEVEGSDARIVTEKVSDPPAYPNEYLTPVGDTTRVELQGGKLAEGESATLTFPYPDDLSAEEAEQLWVMHYDGERWDALPPLAVDTQAHTVTAAAAQFSLWSLSKWDWEDKFDDWARDFENAFSSDGLFSGFGKLVAKPYEEECDYQALTITVDASDFVEDPIICNRFDTSDLERQTYELFISNTQGFPVMLDLPEGVTYVDTKPTPANPYSKLIRFAQYAMNNERSVILPGGGMLELSVDSREMPGDGTPLEITGKLDFTTPILDLSSATLDLMLPVAPSDAVIDKIRTAHEVTSWIGCVLEQAQVISSGPITLDELETALETAVSSCSQFTRALVEYIISVTAEIIYGTVLSPEQLAKLIPAWRVVTTAWDNAHVFTQVASFIVEAIGEGPRDYTLKLTLNDPPLERMWEVLPTPGTKMYLEASNLVEYYELGGGIYGPSVVGYEVAPCLPTQWDMAWVDNTYIGIESYDMSVDSDANEDGADDTMSVDGFVLHVPSAHRDDVSAYFTNMLGVTSCFEEPTEGTWDEWGTDMQQVTVSDWPDQTVGFTGNLLPYASELVPVTNIMAYDSRGYIVVLYTSPGARLQDPYEVYDMSADAILEALVPATDYLFERSDGMLGTTLS